MLSDTHFDRPERHKIINGNCLDVLSDLRSESVQCCVTSPPYWGLRDYDHPHQIGAEPSPADYVENLVAVFREVQRILRNDGTLWLNVGGYARNGRTGGHGPKAIVGNTRRLIQKRSLLDRLAKARSNSPQKNS